ncbi:hypothetical protein Bca4012_037356 [Brassica carinata]
MGGYDTSRGEIARFPSHLSSQCHHYTLPKRNPIPHRHHREFDQHSRRNLDTDRRLAPRSRLHHKPARLQAIELELSNSNLPVVLIDENRVVGAKIGGSLEAMMETKPS